MGRQYHCWCIARNAANGPGGDDVDFLRPVLGHQQTHQLAHDREAKKGSRKKQWHCWGSGGMPDRGKEAIKKEEAEKGMPCKAKKKRKRQGQAMLRYWLHRVAHPHSRS